jgi:DNA mismatch repair protein MutS
MTALAGKLPRLHNVTMRVKEWEGDVVFLHEVAPGAADRSYGIQVARLAGLPEAVLARARHVLGVLERRSSDSRGAVVDDLPLFAHQPVPVKAEINPLEERIDLVRPDDLTPLEAIELVYELKKLRDAARRP